MLMNEFDDIRPYSDHEVVPVLRKLVKDKELIAAVLSFKLPGIPKFLHFLLSPLVRRRLGLEVATIKSVSDFQMLVEKYMQQMIKSSTRDLTVSGLENLSSSGTYLFISNHRDIAMDPAFVNWILFHNKMKTVRIAIGDNLLTKPYASDLMRLNKSFLVKRSVSSPRQMLASFKQLSNYIAHSIFEEKENIWIAQREGRAKDGIDVTEPAIIKMISMSKDKKTLFSDYMNALNIVPVAISYEYDPCDVSKASELYKLSINGVYEKDQQEDLESIAKGITGYKGQVHLAFGQPIVADNEDPESFAKQVDQQVIKNYKLHTSNIGAYLLLNKDINLNTLANLEKTIDITNALDLFKHRLEICPKKYQQLFIAMYANPVEQKIKNLS